MTPTIESELRAIPSVLAVNALLEILSQPQNFQLLRNASDLLTDRDGLSILNPRFTLSRGSADP
ncbi:hypothetical protein [Oscillatoria sp. CS-180]|uniref:hypothetical protein n=1 Tax=Oscillatoria sp. CS-180 TaxID=3021720 RepID=UPI00232CE4DE|nr:hypothetical protein [Oscillatoria sp. CS-180]